MSSHNLQSGDRIDPNAYLSVELSTSHSTVQVRRKKLEIFSESDHLKHHEETKKCVRRSRSRSNSPKMKNDHDVRKKEYIGREDKIDSSRREHHLIDVRHSKPLKWITEGILVRVVSKKAFKGKLYNCILPVTTVLDQATFEVFSSEHNRPITDLREKDVETALPRSKDVERSSGNLTVIIVKGKHKGSIGTVNSIDKKRDKV